MIRICLSSCSLFFMSSSYTRRIKNENTGTEGLMIRYLYDSFVNGS